MVALVHPKKRNSGVTLAGCAAVPRGMQYDASGGFVTGGLLTYFELEHLRSQLPAEPGTPGPRNTLQVQTS